MPAIPREARPARPGLGRLGELAGTVAAIQGRARPSAERALVCLFVASHGIASGPDRIGQARATLASFSDGTAPANAACTNAALGFRAFELALDLPTGDIAREPAMDERACVATMAFGMEAVAGGADLLALGAAGPDADLAAGAVAAALTGEPPDSWLPRGAFTEDEDAIRRALARSGTRGGDPLATLAELGGRDLAALAGAILAARHGRVPVVLDGFAATVAAALLQALDPAALDHCFAGRAGPHPGEARLLARLGLPPLLPDWGIEAPGVSGALALGLVKAATAVAAG
ncbi:MAG: nicotinate-nucleotide--dimethylbenzimidazole phosphoribosyltransferase [Methylobacteriaceae bacterium]|nr:nicotinate-nucleotide--dimethylbenzimidazole phosphoribosyltransferase [Methylobacteriaceae bacterium]